MTRVIHLSWDLIILTLLQMCTVQTGSKSLVSVYLSDALLQGAACILRYCFNN